MAKETHLHVKGICFLLLLLSSFSYGQENAVLKCVDKTECQKEMAADRFYIVDVRTPAEYKKGHISGAENINFYDADFQEQLGELDRDSKIIIYCAVGGRSLKALKMMEQMGFNYVLEVKGGYKAWVKS